ncbi:response regulator [Paenibacillus albus]|uniref:Response regulator n=1 Tax=Paenibacillus albus TaxID=2495582 RepID=A0A3S9AB04_9BACL|nr:response regulator [Paenibacillus albus]AZN42881.1 response regulator [Paenibacillus albus]
MYRVILVDDEEEVRESIRMKVDWSACGFDLVGTFEDGKDAWESFEQMRPDVVITDISMPYMDGLALAGKIVDRYRDVTIVIITGYDDFEYAQQAVKLKVQDFILKPFNYGEFVAMLGKLKGQLDEHQARIEDLTRLRSQLHESFPLLKEQFLERMVTTELSEEEIKHKFILFRLTLPGPSAIALTLDIDEPVSELLRFAVFNIVQEIFEQENGGIVFRTKDERIGILLSGTAQSICTEAQKLAQQTVEAIEKYIKICVSVGIGRPYDAIARMAESHAGATAALEYRFLAGRSKIISIEDIAHGRGGSQVNQSAWERRLMSALKSGRPSDFNVELEAWIAELKAAELIRSRLYFHIQSLLIAIIQMCEASGYDGLEPADWLGQALTYKTLDEVKTWLGTLCEQLLEQIYRKREQDADDLLRRAEAYILDHFADENLSLSEVSQQAYMSMNYFSALFKQKKGQSFIDFLTTVRMEQAKELLVSTALKTYEIASQVGYGDPQYFSVTFKRRCGLTPKEYRAYVREGRP